MPKILKIILADESFEYVGYDEDTIIRSVLLGILEEVHLFHFIDKITMT